MSHSQSQCEDIVAHRHSRDFRMWCTCVQRVNSSLEPQSFSWVVLINACIGQAHSRQGTDGPSCNISYVHPVSVHTCFRKISAALTFCHSHLSFPFQQYDHSSYRTIDVTEVIVCRFKKNQLKGEKTCEVVESNVSGRVIWHLWCVRPQENKCRLSLTKGVLKTLHSFRLNFQGGADCCLHCIYDASGKWRKNMSLHHLAHAAGHSLQAVSTFLSCDELVVTNAMSFHWYIEVFS